MQFSDEEFGVLRESYQQLVSQSLRYSLIQIAVLFVFIISFSYAFERIDTSEVRELRTAIFDEERKLDKLKNPGEPDAAPTPTLTPTPATSSTTPVTNQGVNPSQSRIQMTGTTSDLHTKVLPPPETVISIEKKLSSLREKFEELYRVAFRVKIPFLGDAPSIDLRNWIYSLPFLFLLSEIYLSILRRQIQALRLVATWRLNHNSSEKVTAYDLLLFSDDFRNASPFTKYSGQFFKAIYVTVLFILAAYLVATSKTLWENWDGNIWLRVVLVSFNAIFYARAYVVYIGNKMQAQTEALTGLKLPQSRITVTWAKAAQLGRRLISVFKPRFSLATGSLLIGLTLFSGFSLTSCGTPYRGTQLVRGWAAEEESGFIEKLEYIQDQKPEESTWRKRKVYWPGFTGFVLANFSGIIEEAGGIAGSTVFWRRLAQLGRIVYLFSLGIAGLMMGLSVVAYRYPQILQQSRWYLLAYRLLVALALFVVADFNLALISNCFTNDSSDSKPYIYYIILISVLVGVLCWLIPLWIWLRCQLTKQDAIRSRWNEWRALILILLTPTLVQALVWVAFLTFAPEVFLIGVPLYLSGLLLLLLGCREIARTAIKASS